MNWKDRHIHLAGVLIVWPIAIAGYLVFVAILTASGILPAELSTTAIGASTIVVANAMTAAWIARKKGSGRLFEWLSFVLPPIALLLHNSKEVAHG